MFLSRLSLALHRALLATLLLFALGVAPSPVLAGELTIATWNMSWLTGAENTGNHKRSAADFAILAKYARDLDADVVALQEISDVAGLERVFGDGYVFHLSQRPAKQHTGFAVRKGIAFSALPDYTALDTGRGLRPGAQIAIDTPAGRLRLMAVHMKSGCFSEAQDDARVKADSCKKLYRQVPALENWIMATATATPLYAAIGDYNRRMTDGNGDWILEELGHQAGEPADANVTSLMAGHTPHCWPQFHDFIDHMLVSDAVRQRVVAGSFREVRYAAADRRVTPGQFPTHYPSDHCPIEVRLRTN